MYFLFIFIVWKGDRNRREENEDEDTRDGSRKGSLVTDGDKERLGRLLQMGSAWAMQQGRRSSVQSDDSMVGMRHPQWRNSAGTFSFIERKWIQS